MKRIITILFLLVSMALFAQQEHLPKVAWRTMVRDVVLLTDSTYQVTIAPLDINEPGAMTRTIGNYLKDFEGHTFLIIDSTSTTIDVKDILDVGVGPRIDRQGIIYRSIGDGSSPFLAPVYYNHLDQTAKDYSRRIELSILWKEANLYAQDSAQIQFHEDTLTWDATKSDLENYLSIQAFTDSIPTIKLIRLDSTGFRITESQISDLQNYQLDSDTTIWDATKTDLINLGDSLWIEINNNADSIAIHRTDIDQNTSDIASMQAVSDVIETFTANSGQTTFTLSNSPSREYTVSQNGVILPSSAYSINTNTLSVTGGVWENDRIQINYKY